MQYHGRSSCLQRALYNLSRVHRGVGQRAAEQPFVVDQPIPDVQVHHCEDLVVQALRLQPQEVFDRIGTGKDISVSEASAKDFQGPENHFIVTRAILDTEVA